MLRGKSGEIMRVAICRFIECYSMLNLPIFDYYDLFIEILDDSIYH